MNRTFDVPGPLSLSVKLPAGEIDLETHDSPTADIELAPLRRDEASERLAEEARVELRRRGDGYELVVDAEEGRLGFLSWGNAQLRLTARVPEGTDLQIDSRSADVTGSGTFGAAAVKTASGDTELPRVEGDAVVKSASGDVTIARVGGALVANTASGDVDVAEVGGEVVVKTASGDVELGPVGGTAASVSSASGDVTLASVAQGQVTIQSASGDIDVGIRRGSRLWVDAKSMSGETRSELELGDAPADEEGPLVELRATTMSGDVVVRRAAA